MSSLKSSYKLNNLDDACMVVHWLQLMCIWCFGIFLKNYIEMNDENRIFSISIKKFNIFLNHPIYLKAVFHLFPFDKYSENKLKRKSKAKCDTFRYF